MPLKAPILPKVWETFVNSTVMLTADGKRLLKQLLT